jgi:hypothetical protein
MNTINKEEALCQVLPAIHSFSLACGCTFQGSRNAVLALGFSPQQVQGEFKKQGLVCHQSGCDKDSGGHGAAADTAAAAAATAAAEASDVDGRRFETGGSCKEEVDLGPLVRVVADLLSSPPFVDTTTSNEQFFPTPLMQPPLQPSLLQPPPSPPPPPSLATETDQSKDGVAATPNGMAALLPHPNDTGSGSGFYSLGMSKLLGAEDGWFMTQAARMHSTPPLTPLTPPTTTSPPPSPPSSTSPVLEPLKRAFSLLLASASAFKEGQLTVGERQFVRQAVLAGAFDGGRLVSCQCCVALMHFLRPV